jgi:hypothetical protein
VNQRAVDPKLMAQIFDAVVEAEAAERSPEFQLIAFATAREAAVAVGAQVCGEGPWVGTATQRAEATEFVTPTSNRLEVQQLQHVWKRDLSTNGSEVDSRHRSGYRFVLADDETGAGFFGLGGGNRRARWTR